MRGVVALAAVLLLAACGGGDPPDPYEVFVAEVETLGGDVIPRDDAAVRAMLLCGADDPSDVLGGVPLSEFPTDLALVRAYCPEKE